MAPTHRESSPRRSFHSNPHPVLTLLRRLLLLPLLAPLLAVLLLAALNPRPPVVLRLLTVRSQPLPLGVWLAAGGAGGALLSALATSLALWDGSRRSSRIRPEATEVWSEPIWPQPKESQPREPQAAGGAERTSHQEVWSQAGPQRPPGEPAPTVSVPFRVIRRPAHAVAAPPAAAQGDPVAAAANSPQDDWQMDLDEDNW